MERKTREKRKRKKRVEEISQYERKKIREEERRKIMKEMKREKHAFYSSHISCKSLMKNFMTITKEGIGHILDLTPIGIKGKKASRG